MQRKVSTTLDTMSLNNWILISVAVMCHSIVIKFVNLSATINKYDKSEVNFVPEFHRPATIGELRQFLSMIHATEIQASRHACISEAKKATKDQFPGHQTPENAETFIRDDDIGAVLEQFHNVNWELRGFFSKKFSDTLKKYSSQL